ncbi:MAG: polysaccharide deacetylase family protein [Methylocystaceae bacterium]
MRKPRNYWIFMAVFLTFICLSLALEIYHPAWANEDLNLQRTVLMFPSVLKGDIVTRVNTGGQKLVALTFDDGPDPRYTPKVLNILKQYQVKATFFMVAENAEAHPGLVRQAIKEGHEIENHSYTHPELNRDTLATIDAEIVGTQEVLEGITGRYPIYFRPPKRLYNQHVIKAAHASRMQVILWTVGVENRRCPTPQKMAERVLQKMQPGVIILAHDGLLCRDKTVLALPAIIEGYQEHGYKFVNLNVLIAVGGR